MINNLRISSLATLLVMLSLFSSTAALAEGVVRASYVSIPVSADDKSWNLAAKLSYPLQSGNGAAVLIVHGSGGIDTRGELHTKSLNAAGFVTLEIDLWAARGWMGASFGRPPGVPETLPDAFAALSFLADLEGVDADRIGIVGFSWEASLTGPDQGNVDVVVYPGSYHGFNSSAVELEVTDPFSHQGKGGQVNIISNEKSREQADQVVVEFFSNNLRNENE